MQDFGLWRSNDVDKVDKEVQHSRYISSSNDIDCINTKSDLLLLIYTNMLSVLYHKTLTFCISYCCISWLLKLIDWLIEIRTLIHLMRKMSNKSSVHFNCHFCLGLVAIVTIAFFRSYFRNSKRYSYSPFDFYKCSENNSQKSSFQINILFT